MTPKLADHLPDFAQFLQDLTEDIRNQKITSWKEFAVVLNAFYTSKMMQKIDSIAPGWIEMASHRDGITLSHVTSVFIALYLLPEYEAAIANQRNLMEWAVLFHDITKVPVKEGHDYVHGFKSAAVAGKALTKLGFPLAATVTDNIINEWYDLTYNATIYSENYGETIQDISKLPEIIDGLRQIHQDGAYAIVLTILLHIAIVTDPEYPILSPMSEDDMSMCITPEALPIMKAVFLADGSGWQLFNEDKTIVTERQYHTRTALDAIKRKFLD